MLTPNQREAEALLPLRDMGRMRRKKRVDAKQIGTDLLSRGPQSCGAEAGSARGDVPGSELGISRRFKGVKVSVVDTTAAGDAFNGANGGGAVGGQGDARCGEVCECRRGGVLPGVWSAAVAAVAGRGGEVDDQGAPGMK
jgi:sugar/nucleoside kinase (ribokinase family)